MRYRNLLPAVVVGAALGLSLAARGGESDLRTDPPGEPYQPVSQLVELPDFLPGMGRLYVDPQTLPAGPFLAYDRRGELASTIYMLPLDALANHRAFEKLDTPGGPVVSVDVNYNPGHPGVAEPHYHVTLRHLASTEAALQ